MEEVKDAKELLEETCKVLSEKKIASKTLGEIRNRILSATDGSKETWQTLVKAYNGKGRAWRDDNPLDLDPDEKRKDPSSSLFVKLLNLITAAEAFGQTNNLLSSYFETLEKFGIKISVDPSKFFHLDLDNLEEDLDEELKSVKSYLRTIEEYTDEIQEEHTAKAEALNFAPAKGYMKVVNIFRKGQSGKEIDDDVQKILVENEFMDKAVNLTADYARNSLA